MFNDNQGNIGRYYIYSILFHLILIGLVFYLAIRYKPEIQSVGSNVVVSITSSIPMRHIPTRVVKKRFVKVKRSGHVKVKMVVKHSKQEVKVAKRVAIVSKPVHVEKIIKTHVLPVATVSSSIYAKLSHKVSLRSAYNKVKASLVKGNIQKFIAYSNRIEPIIMSNFNIPLTKYLSYKSVVAIQITDSGRIYDVIRVKSSGSTYFDSQAMEALKLSSPLPPPPKGFMAFINSKNAGDGVLINFDPNEIIKNK